jgi:hypothetical protein
LHFKIEYAIIQDRGEYEIIDLCNTDCLLDVVRAGK